MFKGTPFPPIRPELARDFQSHRKPVRGDLKKGRSLIMSISIRKADKGLTNVLVAEEAKEKNKQRCHRSH